MRSTSERCILCSRAYYAAKEFSELTYASFTSINRNGAHYLSCRMPGGIRKNMPRATWIWLTEVGPIPDDHFIIHVTADLTDDSLENLDCVPRNEMYGNAPKSRRPFVACAACGLPRRLRKNKKYCSPKCSGASRRIPRSTRPCGSVSCHKSVEYVVGVTDYKVSPIYCDKFCYAASGHKTSTCQHCGTTWDAYESCDNKYCSRACYDAYRSAHRAKRLRRECTVCSRTFKVPKPTSKIKQCTAPCKKWARINKARLASAALAASGEKEWENQNGGPSTRAP